MKRQESTHIIICPRLLTAEWMRQFNKAVDFYIEIPAGCCCWPTNMFEPLILGVCFPYIKSPPWQVRRTPKVLAIVRKVCGMFKEENLDPGDILRKFCLELKRLRTMPADVVWRMLHFNAKSKISHSLESESGGKRKESTGHGQIRDEVGEKGPKIQRLQKG